MSTLGALLLGLQLSTGIIHGVVDADGGAPLRRVAVRRRDGVTSAELPTRP